MEKLACAAVIALVVVLACWVQWRKDDADDADAPATEADADYDPLARERAIKAQADAVRNGPVFGNGREL